MMKQPETKNKPNRAVERLLPKRPNSGAAVVKTGDQLIDELVATACEATGTHHDGVACRILIQVSSAQTWPRPTDPDDSLAQASAMIREMAPQNVMEAMLAVQMIATNDAALKFSQRSTSDDQCNEGIDANVLRATRLMRLFIQQIEAMQKLKGKASLQNLTVEQVNVNQGGQAIVGSVSAPKEGG